MPPKCFSCYAAHLPWAHHNVLNRRWGSLLLLRHTNAIDLNGVRWSLMVDAIFASSSYLQAVIAADHINLLLHESSSSTFDYADVKEVVACRLKNTQQHTFAMMSLQPSFSCTGMIIVMQPRRALRDDHVSHLYGVQG